MSADKTAWMREDTDGHLGGGPVPPFPKGPPCGAGTWWSGCLPTPSSTISDGMSASGPKKEEEGRGLVVSAEGNGL